MYIVCNKLHPNRSLKFLQAPELIHGTLQYPYYWWVSHTSGYNETLQYTLTLPENIDVHVALRHRRKFEIPENVDNNRDDPYVSCKAEDAEKYVQNSKCDSNRFKIQIRESITTKIPCCIHTKLKCIFIRISSAKQKAKVPRQNVTNIGNFENLN